MSLIRLQLNRYGHVELSFVNARILRRVLAIVIRNGGPNEPSAYIQTELDIEELLGRLPLRTSLDLRSGWDVTIRMDGWEAAHYYGYDAHTVFDRPPR